MFDADRSGRPSLEHGAHGSRARRCTVKGGFRLNKYKKLMSNTIIFSIGTFSSKLLVFLLMPLYTRVLSPSDYGTVDIITQTASLLMPVVSLSIASGIIRFGLDKRIDKSDVFSIGLVTILAGFGVFFLFSPLLKKITFISQYTLLIYLYVFMALIKQLCAEFVRSKQYVKLYAFDGILATVLTIILNVLFLVVFKWGITGYVLATIVADTLCTLFLFTIAGLHRYIKLGHWRPGLWGSMMRYCIPMIPSAVFWWITNVSDRYMVTYYLGEGANGLYAASYKVPTAIVLLSTIFSDAWQISAVESADSKKRSAFFSNVFSSFQSLLFLGSSGLIMMAKFITSILVSQTFYDSWRYIPVLVIATLFNCFATFIGSVYLVEKKTTLILGTVISGALINIVLNLALIPRVGVNGAAIATLASYFVIYLIRAANSRKYIKINFQFPKMLFNTAILILQAVIMITEIPYWIPCQIALVLVMLLCNFKPILRGVSRIIK